MMLFPDVQRKAQAEMDNVFGGPTLPTVTDQEKLPYLNAIVKESIRWHSVAPLGIPHRTDEDDIINGFLIPKNAIIVPNIWYPSFPITLLCLAFLTAVGHSIMTRQYIPAHETFDQSVFFPLSWIPEM
jgi:hypothetical protein